LEDDAKIAQLRTGTQAAVAYWKGLEAKDRALQSLAEADKELDKATSSVSELEAAEAASIIPIAKHVRLKAKAIYDMAMKKSVDDDE